MDKKFNKRLIFIAAAAVLAVIAAIFFIFMRKDTAGSVQEHLELGQKYLVELDYSNAVLEFTDAINIDPKNPDAYIGLAEAYIGTGDTEKAIETLEKGYEETGDERIKKMLDELTGSSDTENDTEETTVTEEVTLPAETEVSETTVTTEAEAPETVPDFTGMKTGEAVSQCGVLGINYEIKTAVNAGGETGTVISQSVKAGTEITDDMQIVLVVCGQKQAVTTVPVSETSAPVTSAVTEAPKKETEDTSSPIEVKLIAEGLSFDYIADFEDSGWAFAVRGNKGGYLNTDGTYVQVYNDVHELDENGYYNGKYYDLEAGYDAPSLYYVNGMVYSLDYPAASSSYAYYISPFKVNEDGIYPYCKKGKWGYANINTGKIVIPCKYKEVSYFNCGRAIVVEPKSDSDSDVLGASDFKVIDINGNSIFDTETVHVTDGSCFVNNVVIAHSCIQSDDPDWNASSCESTYSLYDINGKKIDDKIQPLPCEMWNIRYNNGVLTYLCDLEVDNSNYSNNSYTSVAIGKNGKKLFEIKDRQILYFSNDFEDVNGYALFYNSRKDICGICDSTGKVIGEFDVYYYQYFGRNNRIFLSDENGLDGKWYLCNFKGEKVSQTAFESGWCTAFDLIPAKLNGKWGLIDTNGNTVIDFSYDEMYYSTGHGDSNNINDTLKYFVAKKDGKICVTDRNNKIIANISGEPVQAHFISNNENIIITLTSKGKYNIYKITG